MQAIVSSGCFFFVDCVPQFLPQVSLKAHATILSTTSRTTLTQSFLNPSDHNLKEASYQFPLYDGVSVVSFNCHVGTRLLHSKVKSKEQANTDYQTAVERQESAATMDQSETQGDVFTIRLGNVPANELVTVEITFIGELKTDAQMDGVRYTLPNSIAPRYQNSMSLSQWQQTPKLSALLDGISITVDILLEKASIIRELQSPSHSPKVSLGRTSSTSPGTSGFEPSQASATLNLLKTTQALLERDYVLVVKADGLDKPRALLETHSTIPGQQALMATLVPKFNLPPNQPEIVFVIDRSGSMQDKIDTLQSALRVFLKSLPLGVCFNICSFGSHYTFLWPTSQVYDSSSHDEALRLVENIDASMGGTNMLPAVKAAVERRIVEKELEVLLLTDGEIMDQDDLFRFVRETANGHTARFFSLGIGHAASHSLIEGVARAGQGFSQSVLENEELDKSVIRMLKGALTPHIYDYKLEVDYETTVDQDYEIVGTDSSSTTETGVDASDMDLDQASPSIPLFSDDFEEAKSANNAAALADELPKISPPKVLQAPFKIPPLYPFIRTTVYLLMDPESDKIPRSLTFKATSKQGPLCLRIPITDIGQGETIHQLASRKAVVELEEGHSWLENIRDGSGNSFEQLHAQTQRKIVARECQNLGIKYQITGKYCSFVALESDPAQTTQESNKKQQNEYEAVTGRPSTSNYQAIYGRPVQRQMLFQQAAMMPAIGQYSSLPAFGCVPVPGAHMRRTGGSPGGHVGSPSFRRLSSDSQPTMKMKVRASASKRAVPLFGQASASSRFGSAIPFGSAATHADASKSVFNSSASQVHSLVGLQNFDGSWTWNQQLFDIIGRVMDEMRANVAAKLQQSGKRDLIGQREANFVATLMVMGLLKRDHLDSKSLWELVYEKADWWVQKELAEMHNEIFDAQSIGQWMSFF
ncbi:hypothetical protein N7466_008406 [Penicillium verhagenii]|uniref:uncharacterized protein n=1 Tax=Penicillium verhagenii TaxID=1562060 RepID=UPI002545BC84|nr:uncharacterized protein N7466_008406 [Penicillium verhagenii]KAJ5924219.1 hypothetical protein N7466_008406 [Penicillium verhagenii]